MDLLLTTILLGTIPAIITQICKQVSFIGKMGDTGKQLLVLLFAILLGGINYGWQYVPLETATGIAGIWAFAIAWYELLIKKFTT